MCNTAFSQQQWLHERASLLRCTSTLHVLFIMLIIDWLGVSETPFRFLVGPWFVMFARMHFPIFVAHSYYNPFTSCEYCCVCRSIHNSKEEFVPYLNVYNLLHSACRRTHVLCRRVELVFGMHWYTSEFNCH
jgi:hypothetical protein